MKTCLQKTTCALISLLALLTVCISGCGEKTVVFPDNDLELMIRNAINRPQGAIYPTDLQGIRTLKLSMKDIYEVPHTIGKIFDLTGLEYCTGLEFLDMNTNPITDLSPLASLKNLRTLIINQAEITDLSPLANLTLLETLELEDNRIQDISPLATCTNLREVYLANNRIEDISAITHLVNLEVLVLGPLWPPPFSYTNPLVPGNSNRVSNLSPLSNLPNLEYLNLNANMVTDLTPLTSVRRLKSLFLYANLISDLYPLVSLGSIEELNLYDNVIDNLSPLMEMKGLKKIALTKEMPNPTEFYEFATAFIEKGGIFSNSDTPPLHIKQVKNSVNSPDIIVIRTCCHDQATNGFLRNNA